MAAFHHSKQRTALVYDLLPPERGAERPQAGRFERKPDVADADFVIVSADRRSSTSSKVFSDTIRRTKAKPAALPTPGPIAACLHVVEAWLQRASARTFGALVAALAVLAFVWSGGLSSLLAQPAVPGGALSFSHVTLTPRDANGMRVLVLNGIVDNETGADAPVSAIRADFVVGDRLVSSVVVASPTDRLAAGESRGFMARVPHPGGKTPEVRLSFMPSAVSQP